MDSTEYTKELKYLPDFFKDFHDQKDVMKVIYDLYKDDEAFKKFPNTWVDSHVFLVDFFLYFMSLHGYKLQKIKKKDIEFFNIDDTVKHFKEKRIEILSKILKTPWNTKDGSK